MLKLGTKQVLSRHISAEIVWGDDGSLQAASLAFTNMLLSPELRALGLPDPDLPPTLLNTSMAGLDMAKVEAWRKATIALFEDELCYSQLAGVTKE